MKKNLFFVFCLIFFFGFTSSGQNLITNGSFENGFANWTNLAGGTSAATFSIDTIDKVDSANAMKVVVTTAGANGYDVQSINSAWASVSGTQYTLSIYAKADVAGRILRVVQQTNTYASMDFSLTTAWQKYQWTFTAQEANLQLRFNFPVAGTFRIDQISIPIPVPPSLTNLIPNGGFENNFTSWTNLAGGTSSAVFSIDTAAANRVQGSKAMKVAVATAGANAYDVQSINSAWASVSGTQYTLSFYAKADAAGRTLRVVQQTNTYASMDFSLTTAFQRYQWTFTAQEANLQLRFNFPVAGTFYIDTVSIPAPTVIIVPPPPYRPTGPVIALGKPKFLGGAYSTPQKINFGKYWNQITPENGGKWGTAEPTRGVFNWTELDSAYKLAKDSGYPFKMHTLIWGSQQPAWIESLPADTQLAEIKIWFKAVAARYPAIDFIEVVNEPLHQQPNHTGNGGGNYINALGGAGASGYDWILNSFRMARQYFPAKTKLWINDYSIINSSASTAQYLQIINLLKKENLIDGIGEQGHAFTTYGTSLSTLTNNLNTLATANLPLYITELDIDGPPPETPQGDTVQLNEYMRVFPALWAHPAVRGITMWGYLPGHWRTAQGAPLAYANGAEKAALKWMRQYVQNTSLSITPTAFTGCPNVNLALVRGGNNTYNGEVTSIYNIDTTTGVATATVGFITDPNTGNNMNLNGVGFNSSDGFLYGIRDTGVVTATKALFYRVGANYGAQLLGTIAPPTLLQGETSSAVNPAAGSFDASGNYYFTAVTGMLAGNQGSPTNYYVGKLTGLASLTPGSGTITPTYTKIDFTAPACSSLYANLTSPITTTGPMAGTGIQDIAYNNAYNNLYFFSAFQSPLGSGSYKGQLVRVNPTTGVANCYTAVSPFSNASASNEVAGISSTVNGNLMILMTGGDMYKTTKTTSGDFTGVVSKIGASGILPTGVTGNIRGDLASCGVGVPLTSVINPLLPQVVTAYPNPAHGLATVSTTNMLNNATVSLIGLAGNVISQTSGVSGTTFQLDLTNKPSGIYVVEISQNGNISRVKIAKE